MKQELTYKQDISGLWMGWYVYKIVGLHSKYLLHLGVALLYGSCANHTGLMHSCDTGYDTNTHILLLFPFSVTDMMNTQKYNHDGNSKFGAHV